MKHEVSVVIALYSHNFTSSSILILIYIFILFYLCIQLFIFETRFLCVSLTVMALALYTRLSLTSEIQLPLLPSAGIKGFPHQCQAESVFLNYHVWALAVLVRLVKNKGSHFDMFFHCPYK